MLVSALATGVTAKATRNQWDAVSEAGSPARSEQGLFHHRYLAHRSGETSTFALQRSERGFNDFRLDPISEFTSGCRVCLTGTFASRNDVVRRKPHKHKRIAT